MKEETKKVLLYKPRELLAIDRKPLKFLDAELLCLISQPAARAKCKCWWFQLADAARLHQLTVPVTLPLSRAVPVSTRWWTFGLHHLCLREGLHGGLECAESSAFSGLTISKRVKTNMFFVAPATFRSGLSPCFPEDSTVNGQLPVNGWCIYWWLDTCL